MPLFSVVPLAEQKGNDQLRVPQQYALVMNRALSTHGSIINRLLASRIELWCYLVATIISTTNTTNM